jgi:LacI family transcriptional regulator
MPWPQRARVVKPISQSAPGRVAQRAVTTLRDVARLAGVSPATVSRILNGTAVVADQKRQAVEAAIAQLAFKPNLSARGLRSGSSMTIGVLTQELESPHFTAAVKGIDEGLLGSGYAPVVVPGHWNPVEENERVRMLIARHVDAVAIVGGSLSDREVQEFASQLPVAITGRRLEADNLMSFHLDQREGGRLAAEHLISLGHRRIAQISGPPTYRDARERAEGFMLAHAQAGLPMDPRLIVQGNFEESGGEAAMNVLLDGGQPFTAVVCGNDQTLFGARLALMRRGLRVPEDISIVGFDDLPIARYMTPPVTTVRQPMFDIGLAVAAALLTALGAAPQRPAGVPRLGLVVRESTRPPG